jgi:hypothetical protein
MTAYFLGIMTNMKCQKMTHFFVVTCHVAFLVYDWRLIHIVIILTVYVDLLAKA